MGNDQQSADALNDADKAGSTTKALWQGMGHSWVELAELDTADEWEKLNEGLLANG